MADATHSTISNTAPLPSKAGESLQATYPLPSSQSSISGQREQVATLLRGGPVAKNYALIAAKRRQWEQLNLRQQWTDEAFMRGHLRKAGLRVGLTAEPATVPRVKSLLRSVGVHSPEVQQAVGMPLGKYLESNPRLPLWAAIALVLEGTGRFTPELGATL